MKTDLQIQQDVLAELKWDPKVNPAHIGVEVKDGVVTLSGHVDNYAEKLNAENAAKRVASVKVIAVELDVVWPGSKQKNDTEIAKAAMNALKWNVYQLADSVTIKVEDGFVTLNGEVPWNFERESAEYCIRYLAGVRGILNHIKVRPKISVTTIKEDIEKALKRRAHEQAQEITVSVSGDEVLLGGKIHDWKEKSLAIDAAWAVPGVKKVVDNTSFI
jgi:osmotically-inducible protein OsmY